MARCSATLSFVMEVLILGAGQDVGKSCIVVSIANKTIMLDCGLHPNTNVSNDVFPDFELIGRQQHGGGGPLKLDLVVITHLHVDHVGALPVLVHHFGYNGPILASLPSKAMAQIMLSEASKYIASGNKQFEHCYTENRIQDVCDRIIAIPVKQEYKVGANLTLTTYYAGHVLGANMVLLESRDGESIFYTGDFNMTADRHLGAAKPPLCRPDILITESTYADFVRDSKKQNERFFLHEVQECLANAGKVLISSSSVGRAQELCVLLESCWENLPEFFKVPLYFNKGMAWQATSLYRLFVNWTSQDIKSSYLERDIYDFRHVQELDVSKIVEAEGPMIIFASPGMLMGGHSLRLFKKLAPDSKNLVVLPGYPLPGTTGHEVLNAKNAKVTIEGESVAINCKVSKISFSAHTDSTGIFQMIESCRPSNVVFVHGEKKKMHSLKQRAEEYFGIPCFVPSNREVLNFPAPNFQKCALSQDILSKISGAQGRIDISGILMKNSHAKVPCLMSFSEAAKSSQCIRTISFRFRQRIPDPIISSFMKEGRHSFESLLHWLYSILSPEIQELRRFNHYLELSRVRLEFKSFEDSCIDLEISWPYEEEMIALKIRTLLNCLLTSYISG